MKPYCVAKAMNVCSPPGPGSPSEHVQERETECESFRCDVHAVGKSTCVQSYVPGEPGSPGGPADVCMKRDMDHEWNHT